MIAPSRAASEVRGAPWRARFLPLATLLALGVSAPLPLQAQSSLYHVAVGGSDLAGEGSADRPWASIRHALLQVPDAPGVVILVGDGRYADEAGGGWARRFESSVTLRSERRYQAELLLDGQRRLEIAGSGIALGGFSLRQAAGPGDPAAAPALLRLSGERLRITDCRFLEATGGDLVAIEGGARDIALESNLLAAPGPGGNGIRIADASAVRIAGNILSDASAGSALAADRTLIRAGLPYRAAGALVAGRSRDLRIERNILIHATDSPGSALIDLGTAIEPSDEPYARDIVIESNLFLGLPGKRLLAPLRLTASEGVTVRANTFLGDFPALAFLVFAREANSAAFHNNILADPTGSMDPLAPGASLPPSSAHNNLFWNAGRPIPDLGSIGPDLDPAAVLADPRLPDPADFDPASLPLPDEAISETFARLSRFAATAAGSPAIDRADGAQMPLLDLAGQPRGVPDIGALEHRSSPGPTPTATPSLPLPWRLHLPHLSRSP